MGHHTALPRIPADNPALYRDCEADGETQAPARFCIAQSDEGRKWGGWTTRECLATDDLEVATDLLTEIEAATGRDGRVLRIDLDAGTVEDVTAECVRIAMERSAAAWCAGRSDSATYTRPSEAA